MGPCHQIILRNCFTFKCMCALKLKPYQSFHVFWRLRLRYGHTHIHTVHVGPTTHFSSVAPTHLDAFARSFAEAPERLTAKATMAACLQSKKCISITKCVAQFHGHICNVWFPATIWFPAVPGLAMWKIALVIHFICEAAFVMSCRHRGAFRTWAWHWARRCWPG